MVVASVAAELQTASIDRLAIRLRSWALIRCVPISGAPFVALTDVETRVCLPLYEEPSDGAETGMRVELIPGGPVAVVEEVPLEELARHVEQFTQRLAPESSLRCPAEYLGGFSGRGLLTLPLWEMPAVAPVELMYVEAPHPISGRGVSRRNRSRDW